MSNMTAIEKLEEEIAEKKAELHRLKYGELEDAYDEFEKARKIAIEKFNEYKDIAYKNNKRTLTSRTYFF